MGTYTREFSKSFGMDIDLSIQQSFLVPSLTNASASFSRGRISVRPFILVPLNANDTKRLKVGVGLDSYFSTVLNMETEKLVNGTNGNWYYNKPLGYHFSCVYEQFVNDNFSLMAGGKVSNVTYKFESSDVNWYPSESSYTDPNGLTFYLIFGAGYHF